MKHPWHIWLVFVLFLAVVLAVMGWTSLAVLRLDRVEATARRQAALEENVRLALWRMDTTLTPLLAQENARPYFAYRSFFPVDRGYSRMFNRAGGEPLVPSPLLGKPPPHVLAHFQFEPDGQLTSPQVPTGTNLKLAVPQHVSEEAVRRAQSQLAQVDALVDCSKLLAMLPENAPEPVEVVISPLVQTPQQRLAQRQQRQVDLRQQGRGTIEFNQRNQAVQQSANVMVRNRSLNAFSNLPLPSTDVGGVLMTPLWLDGQLVLARRIAADGREYVQGCLLDWPAIKTSLLSAVEDLLVGADLQPVATAVTGEEARMLAALPVRLVPGRPTAEPSGTFLPIRVSLLVAWGCVLLATAAVAGLLWGVIRLSERRATFVSAVTHELRTPLTTFQMYAEMLAEDMVPDEQRRHYLNTLRTEAARLTHLVENVLSYARLERGRTEGRLEHVSLGQLVDQVSGRLAGRAEKAGMELVVEMKWKIRKATVRTNSSAVEQILFNLVDNACKYAADAADKRIHLGIEHRSGMAQMSLRDHGPGLSRSAQRRLFNSFSKSAREAAHTAPGVGLGLALSRRLARHLGGDLQLDESTTDGARFVLTLAGTPGEN